MRMLNFAKRSFKEIIRDPLSIIFAVALPMFLLFIFRQFNIPGEVYKIENLTPGIIIFGFSFISMFTATLVAKDRGASLLVRLGVSPMSGADYVGGYALAVLPLVLLQNVLFFALALVLKLEFTVGIFYTALASLPISVLFIALGIFIGSVTSERSSAGVSSVIVQLVAFTSGMYFDGDMVSGFFGTVCDILPFSHAVDILRAALSGGGDALPFAVLILCAYGAVCAVLAAVVFKRNMTR